MKQMRLLMIRLTDQKNDCGFQRPLDFDHMCVGKEVAVF